MMAVQRFSADLRHAYVVRGNSRNGDLAAGRRHGRHDRRGLRFAADPESPMDTTPAPFIPPAPKPRTAPPSFFEMIRIVYRNPLELWGEPSYNEPWISVTG